MPEGETLQLQRRGVWRDEDALGRYERDAQLTRSYPILGVLRPRDDAGSMVVMFGGLVMMFHSLFGHGEFPLTRQPCAWSTRSMKSFLSTSMLAPQPLLDFG